MNTTDTTFIGLVDSCTTTNYTFEVEKDGTKYRATVYLNESGKFIDETVNYLDGEILDYEGEEGEIREEILTQIDKDWYKLVG
jgi:hypothetical protein